MSVSRSALMSEAAAFLSHGGPMAWEAASAQRTTALLTAFTTGEIDAPGLRAALATERHAPLRAPSSAPVVSLMGPLTANESIFSMLGVGTSVRAFMRALVAADADRSAKAIIVVVDSPGGSIRMLPEAAHLMRQIRVRKPIVVTVAGMSASAAYWLSANASAIEATQSADVGAIGIFMQRASIVRLLEKQGIDVEVFAAGKYKAEGLETTAITDAERTRNQQNVEAAYTDFISDVAAGRQTAASLVRAGYGEGRLVSAKDALRLGMIDRVAAVEDTIARAVSAPASIAALHHARLEAARLAPKRGEQGLAEIAERRIALAAAARGHVG